MTHAQRPGCACRPGWGELQRSECRMLRASPRCLPAAAGMLTCSGLPAPTKGRGLSALQAQSLHTMTRYACCAGTAHHCTRGLTSRQREMAAQVPWGVASSCAILKQPWCCPALVHFFGWGCLVVRRDCAGPNHHSLQHGFTQAFSSRRSRRAWMLPQQLAQGDADQCCCAGSAQCVPGWALATCAVDGSPTQPSSSLPKTKFDRTQTCLLSVN